jgi:hypothetical protein
VTKASAPFYLVLEILTVSQQRTAKIGAFLCIGTNSMFFWRDRNLEIAINLRAKSHRGKAMVGLGVFLVDGCLLWLIAAVFDSEK